MAEAIVIQSIDGVAEGGNAGMVATRSGRKDGVCAAGIHATVAEGALAMTFMNSGIVTDESRTAVHARERV
jgi:hypothetical protein